MAHSVSRVAAYEMWPVPLIVRTADPGKASDMRKALRCSLADAARMQDMGAEKTNFSNGVVGSAVVPINKIGVLVVMFSKRSAAL